MEKVCRKKWMHEHLKGGQIKVWRNRNKRGWVVTIMDDGSICDRDVERPEGRRWL